MKLIVIAFTRDPVSAAGSLYTQYLKFGTGRPFRGWLMQNGRQTLDHDAIVKRWTAQGLTVRSMDLGGLHRGDGLLRQFERFLDLDPDVLREGSDPVANARITFHESVALFYANHLMKRLECNTPDHRRQVHHLIYKRINDAFGWVVFPFELAPSQRQMVSKLFGQRPLPTRRPKTCAPLNAARCKRLPEWSGPSFQRPWTCRYTQWRSPPKDCWTARRCTGSILCLSCPADRLRRPRGRAFAEGSPNGNSCVIAVLFRLRIF